MIFYLKTDKKCSLMGLTGMTVTYRTQKYQVFKKLISLYCSELKAFTELQTISCMRQQDRINKRMVHSFIFSILFRTCTNPYVAASLWLLVHLDMTVDLPVSDAVYSIYNCLKINPFFSQATFRTSTTNCLMCSKC